MKGGTLPGYYLEQDPPLRTTVLMIGGGDTFREDLFYYAGYPGWKRGYNVLMVDLPGQGKTPAQAMHFRVDAAKPIVAALDWLEAHATAQPQQIAIMNFNNQDRQWFVILSTFASAQCQLREGSPAMGTEMLRCAQHDTTDFGR